MAQTKDLYFLTVWEGDAEKSMTEVPPWLGVGESTKFLAGRPLCRQEAAFCVGKERGSKPSGASSYNDINPLPSGSTLMTSFNLTYFHKCFIFRNGLTGLWGFNL